MNNQTLLKLSSGQLSKKKAYRELYAKSKNTRFRKAHFIKIRIIIPDEVGVSRFLAFLFLLPFPICFAKMILRRMKNTVSNEIPMSKEELMGLISVKGIKIDVNSNSGERIYIKTM